MSVNGPDGCKGEHRSSYVSFAEQKVNTQQQQHEEKLKGYSMVPQGLGLSIHPEGVAVREPENASLAQ